MWVLFQCFITHEKSNTFLSKAYLRKSHENVNFILKLIKRWKKLIIKILASVLVLLIKKTHEICDRREKTEREIFIPLDDDTSSGLRFDLKTFHASCDISWLSLCLPFDHNSHIRFPWFPCFSQQVLTRRGQKLCFVNVHFNSTTFFWIAEPRKKWCYRICFSSFGDEIWCPNVLNYT